MGKKTGIIKFNVKERGRKFIGQDRKFDTRALAALVNGDEVQERVKNRDLTGFYGHIIRMKFGIRPPEMVMVEGKPMNIEPAMVTTSVRADEDGNIEHEAEFLDTDAGVMAQRLFESRTGGFSSAIWAATVGGRDVPQIFAGFDYVFEPNFTTNRGYVLDSVNGGIDQMLLDAVYADHTQAISFNKAIYDSLARDHDAAIDTMARMKEEMEDLYSIIARHQSAGSAGAIVLDSADAAARPITVSRAATLRFERSNRAFQNSPLTQFDRPASDTDKDDAALRAAQSHYGV